MINVDVLVDYLIWKKRINKPNFFFNRILKSFPKKYKFLNKKVHFTLLLSNNKNIKRLNFKFRKKNKSTDVLSFPLNKKIDKKLYLGDIIISYEFMNKPQLSGNTVFRKKVIKIFIHGFLHLIGYDHKKNKDFKKMSNEEIKIFNLVESKFEKVI